jgi:hypothetical protein
LKNVSMGVEQVHLQIGQCKCCNFSLIFRLFTIQRGIKSPYSSVLLLKVVAHVYSGPPVYNSIKLHGRPEMSQSLRIMPERRSGKDRRRIFSLHRFFHKGPERREALPDRRLREERRDGWVGISKVCTLGRISIIK